MTKPHFGATESSFAFLSMSLIHTRRTEESSYRGYRSLMP